MTDYFALLDQPRRPWLDPDGLKQAFHERTLRQHPDAQASSPNGGGGETEFARINEAYQTLQDPKLRLQHLLALTSHASASRFDSVPADIADLFPAIAQLTQDATRVAEQSAGATSALSRSLLTSDIVQVRNRISTLLATLTQLHAEADAELHEVDAGFVEGDEAVMAALQRLYVRYSYLRRWITQLGEHRTVLATM